MSLHCSCIDMQTHTFDFFYLRPKFGILTAYILSITIHFIFFQTTYFPNSFIVMSSPSVFFSLFVVIFWHYPGCSLVEITTSVLSTVLTGRYVSEMTVWRLDCVTSWLVAVTTGNNSSGYITTKGLPLRYNCWVSFNCNPQNITLILYVYQSDVYIEF